MTFKIALLGFEDYEEPLKYKLIEQGERNYSGVVAEAAVAWAR